VDGSVSLWDPTERFGRTDTGPWEFTSNAVTNYGSVLSLAASTRDPSNQLIAVGYKGGLTVVFKLLTPSTGDAWFSPTLTGEHLLEGADPAMPVKSVAFVETDEETYAVTASGNAVRLYTLAGQDNQISSTSVFAVHTDVINTIVVTMGGRCLVCADFCSCSKRVHLHKGCTNASRKTCCLRPLPTSF
jgi:hypothetical protein